MTKQHCPRRMMGEHHELHLPCDAEEIRRQQAADICQECVDSDWWCQKHYDEMMARIGVKPASPNTED